MTRLSEVSSLNNEIAAYARMKTKLEAECLGSWVVIRNEAVVGTFDSLETAAPFALGRFGRGPFLIREVGAPPAALPASVLYRPITED